MSPPADPASALAAPDTLVPERLLHDAEVVLYASRPSPLFVLLVSGPVIGLAAAVMAALTVADKAFGFEAPLRMVGNIALAVVLVRLVAACMQWSGRLYVLTNLRVLRLRGAMRVDLWECPLTHVQRIEPMAGPGERLLGLGGIAFYPADARPPAEWSALARPAEVLELVNETIRRGR